MPLRHTFSVEFDKPRRRYLYTIWRGTVQVDQRAAYSYSDGCVKGRVLCAHYDAVAAGGRTGAGTLILRPL